MSVLWKALFKGWHPLTAEEHQKALPSSSSSRLRDELSGLCVRVWPPNRRCYYLIDFTQSAKIQFTMHDKSQGSVISLPLYENNKTCESHGTEDSSHMLCLPMIFINSTSSSGGCDAIGLATEVHMGDKKVSYMEMEIFHCQA